MKKITFALICSYNKYLLAIIVFFSGAVIMIIELVGSRILTPYYGGSINVWTVLIGIILGSLSIGYWLGGKIADKKPQQKYLSLILLSVSLYLAGLAVFKDVVILYVDNIFSLNMIFNSFVTAILLFSIPNLLLAIITPYVIRLQLISLKNSGAKVGNLYAVSTIGSIVGTFAAGLILIPQLGVDNILLVISCCLIILAILLTFPKMLIRGIISVLIILLTFRFISTYQKRLVHSGIIDVNSAYGRIFVYIINDISSGENIRYLITGAYGSQSRQTGRVYSPYIYYIDQLINQFQNPMQSMLIIGGGGFNMPDYFNRKYSSLKVDVVEIDPVISRLAYQYFNHPINDRQTTYFEDGRVFLNKNKNKYSVIVNDAYVDIYPPYQLITVEATKHIYKALDQNGIYIINVISPLDENNGRLFHAVFKTLASVFPNVAAIPLQSNKDLNTAQNILLISVKSNKLPSFIVQSRWQGKISKIIPILSDDYAPVESYLLPVTMKKPEYPISRMILNQSVFILKKQIQELFML